MAKPEMGGIATIAEVVMYGIRFTTSTKNNVIISINIIYIYIIVICLYRFIYCFILGIQYREVDSADSVVLWMAPLLSPNDLLGPT